ncbi:MAG: carbohydrate binding domain-containing protein [Armatimonadota bacterium]
MRAWYLPYVGLAAVLIFCVGVHASEIPVVNPGFEGGLEGEAPAGWHPYGGGTKDTALEMDDDAHSGDYSLRVIDEAPEIRDSKYATGVYQEVEAQPGKTYRATVWVKAISRNNEAPIYMQIRFLPDGQRHSVVLAPPVGGDWTSFSTMGTAPEGTEEIRLYLHTSHYHKSVTLLDDVSIEEIDIEARPVLQALLAHSSMGVGEVRDLNLRTPVVADGAASATILVPEGDDYTALGQQIAAAVEERSGVGISVTSEYEGTVESDETIIALGNLNNNRMIERLYFNKYLQIDAQKPGPGAYVLQIVHEPYNSPKGKNVVIIGASDNEGLNAGVEDFISHLGEGPDIVLDGPMLYVSDAEPMTKAAREDLLNRPFGRNRLREFWMEAQKYRDTGDPAHAERAKLALQSWTEQDIQNPAHRLHVSDEFTSDMLGAMWDFIEEAPVFTDEERLECTNLLLTALYILPHHTSGYHGLENNDTLIWNHTTFPLTGIYWLARYFKRYYGNVDGRMDLMLAKVHAAFEGQIDSWKPQEDSMGYYSYVPHHTIEYTLAENDYRYFKNGSVRTHADYTMFIADNTGDPGGFGDNPYRHMPYVRNIHWALWYYKDGKYLWWLDKVLPNGYDNPYDQNITPEPAPEIAGTRLFPLHRKVYDYTKDKSYYRGPLSPPNIPFEKSFDKIAFRENLDANGEYMLLDGYSRGKHLQYDGNAITKFYADGHDWLIDGDYLVRNTTDHNMVSVIKEGRCEELIPTCTAVDALADLPSAGITRTRVREYNGATWRRTIVWLKGEFTVVLDDLQAEEAGDFSFLNNFKTLGDSPQQLQDGRIFVTRVSEETSAGNRGLAMVETEEARGGKAVRLARKDAQVDTLLDIPAGTYELTTFARGNGTSTDSLYGQVDGGERVVLHVPIGTIGASSSSHTKDTPTPNIEVTGEGPHRLTITLREGPGVVLDRFMLRDQQGNVVADYDTEDAPEVPADFLKDEPVQRFFVKNDGLARNALASRINHAAMKITYLRQRAGGVMEPGDTVRFANIFYNDTSDDPKDYDIRRVDETNVLILKNGDVFGSVTALPIQPDSYHTELVTMWGDAVQRVMDVTDRYARELDFTTDDTKIRVTTCKTLPAADGDVEEDTSEVDPTDRQGWADSRSKSAARMQALADRVIEPPKTQQPVVEAPETMQAIWQATPEPSNKEFLSPIQALHPVDLDGDGAEEVVVLFATDAICYDTDGTELWRLDTGGTTRAVDHYDITGDGRPEVFIGSGDEHVYVLSAKGETIQSHHCDIAYKSGSTVSQPKVSTITVGDLEDDGEIEVAVGLLNANFVVYDVDFNELWRAPRVPHGSREVQFVDLDFDGPREVLVANKYGHIQIYDTDGTPMPTITSELGDVEMAVGNMDDDREWEIANGSATGVLTCVQWPEREGFEFTNYGFNVNELIMADITGDGYDDLCIASATGYAYVLDADGEIIAQRKLGDGISDLTLMPGDEPILACSTGGGYVYLTDADIQPLASYSAGAPVTLVQPLQGEDGLLLMAATEDTVICLQP